jgi:hypothetical protein
MAKNKTTLHYDKFKAKAKERDIEMQKLDEFVQFLLGSNKEAYEIQNIVTYYVAAAWDCSYEQKREDHKIMEESKCTTK